MEITTVILDGDRILVSVESSEEPTSATVTDIKGDVSDLGTPTVEGEVYSYELAGDYIDGVYEVIVTTTSDSDSIVAGNLAVGYSCLTHKTLNAEYDCTLLQDLFSVTYFIKANDPISSKVIYTKVLNKCTECSSSEVLQLSGISVWYVNSNFIVQ